MLASSKGGRLVSAEQKQRNLIVYLAARDVLKRLYATGEIGLEVLERLNRKNAEKTDCPAIAII